MTTTGYVLFRLFDQTFASALDDVREIVRLGAIDRMPGAEPPFAGVVVVRGTPLPIIDVRERDGDAHGDVLVLDADGDAIGIAVDQVLAVLAPDELEEADPPSRTLPAYVTGVRRHGDAPVLLVDLRRLSAVAVG